MFAVVKIGGQQFKVREKDELDVEKLDVKEGENLKIKDVYLISEDDASGIKIGMPYVAGAHVECQVIGQWKGEKIRVFKFHSKKRYKKTYGHRSHYTKLKVLKISAVQKKSLSSNDAVVVTDQNETVAVKKAPAKKKVVKA